MSMRFARNSRPGVQDRLSDASGLPAPFPSEPGRGWHPDGLQGSPGRVPPTAVRRGEAVETLNRSSRDRIFAGAGPRRPAVLFLNR